MFEIFQKTIDAFEAIRTTSQRLYKSKQVFWVYVVAEIFWKWSWSLPSQQLKLFMWRLTMRATELGILWPCVPVISAHVQDDLRYIIVCNLTSIWYVVARFWHCALKFGGSHRDKINVFLMHLFLQHVCLTSLGTSIKNWSIVKQ